MSNNFLLLMPEFLVTGLAFLVLTADFFLRGERMNFLPFIAMLGLIGTLVFTLVYQWDRLDSLYDGLVVIDGYALFFKAFFMVLGVVVIVLFWWLVIPVID